MKKLFTYLNDLFIAIMVVSFRPMKTRENLDYWKTKADQQQRERKLMESENQRLTSAIKESVKLSGWKSDVRVIYSASERIADGRDMFGCTLTPNDNRDTQRLRIYFEASTPASALAGALTQLNANLSGGSSPTGGGDDTIQINNN